MTPFRNSARKRLIEKQRARREGRRFHAFYRGVSDRRAERSVNPFRPGSQEAQCWDAGRKYVEDDT